MCISNGLYMLMLRWVNCCLRSIETYTYKYMLSLYPLWTLLSEFASTATQFAVSHLFAVSLENESSKLYMVKWKTPPTSKSAIRSHLNCWNLYWRLPFSLLSRYIVPSHPPPPLRLIQPTRVTQMECGGSISTSSSFSLPFSLCSQRTLSICGSISFLTTCALALCKIRAAPCNEIQSRASLLTDYLFGCNHPQTTPTYTHSMMA